MSKTVIVAPLNWGLGHATRSKTVIDNLLTAGCKVIIASDGNSLKILKRQFPFLHTEELPSYSPVYPSDGNMAWAMLKQAPGFELAVAGERHPVGGEPVGIGAHGGAGVEQAGVGQVHGRSPGRGTRACPAALGGHLAALSRAVILSSITIFPCSLDGSCK